MRKPNGFFRVYRQTWRWQPCRSAILDKLPGTKDESATAIRARAEQDDRGTAVLLPHSTMEGKAVRFATDRRFPKRAPDLGFRRYYVMPQPNHALSTVLLSEYYAIRRAHWSRDVATSACSYPV
jgi:hypothetical protein